MDEGPSSLEDGPEGALRRALSDAVSGVEPGTEGLDRIRARIGGRPPSPWLLAVLSGAVERVRSWTWRGHWAWPGRLLTRTFPVPGALGTWRIGVLWLATGLASITVIASVSLGVQPVRRAIIAASAVLDPAGALSQHGAGTSGAGGQTTANGTGPLADGGVTAAPQPSPTSASGSGGGPGGAAPGPASAQCQPPTSGPTGKLAPTASVPGATSSSSSAVGTIRPVARHTSAPVAPGTTGAPDQPTATPDPPGTSASACTETPATATTTPTVATGASSTPAGAGPSDTGPAGPTPTDTPPTETPTSTPTDTTPADTPTTTPTDTPTTTPTDTPTSTPTDTPTPDPALT